MKKYIGVKQIQATEMNLGDYNIHKGWTIPENEDPKREGYLVKYSDGYESWSPKEIFEEAYKETTGLTFGLAIEALKKGKMVARQGWNGKGMFIFMRPEDTLTTGIVAKVKSLPEEVKEWIDKNVDDKVNQGESGLTPIKFTSYLCMKAADNTIVNGWLASQTDMLSEDWCILE